MRAGFYAAVALLIVTVIWTEASAIALAIGSDGQEGDEAHARLMRQPQYDNNYCGSTFHTICDQRGLWAYNDNGVCRCAGNKSRNGRSIDQSGGNVDGSIAGRPLLGKK